MNVADVPELCRAEFIEFIEENFHHEEQISEEEWILIYDEAGNIISADHLDCEDSDMCFNRIGNDRIQELYYMFLQEDNGRWLNALQDARYDED